MGSQRSQSLDSRSTLSELQVGDRQYHYYSLKKAAESLGDLTRLPFTLKVLLENQLRFEDGDTATKDDIKALADWQKTASSTHEIGYRPARVLMKDFTGVPGVVDLASMRDAVKTLGREPREGQSADPGGSGHRPLGDGGSLR